MELSKFNEYVTAANIGANIEVGTVSRPLAYPYCDVAGRVNDLAVARFARVKQTDMAGNITQHTVVVGYYIKSSDGSAHFGVWCGDKFIEGRNLDSTAARTRCAEAAGARPNRTKLIDEMMESFDAHDESDRCDFWIQWRRKETLCPHTDAVLAHLRDTEPGFQEQLVADFEALTSGVTTAVPLGETLSLTELAFRVPVLFEGERGAGKTVEARAFARANKHLRVEFGGHAGIEAPDMLGYLVPYSAGQMVWKDGPIAEAFRRAKTQKTVLIIDELLRIRERELSILLTALSPDTEEDGTRVYRLRTGRILDVVDGVASEEELTCPVANLCVIATTNVGSEYAVDELDPALAERFVIIRKDTTEAQLKSILEAVAASLKLPKSIVTKCLDFFKKMTAARERGLVARTPTTRTLVRSLELATDADDVVRVVKTQVPLWVARNAEGHPVPEQVDDVRKIIEQCFKKK